MWELCCTFFWIKWKEWNQLLLKISFLWFWEWILILWGDLYYSLSADRRQRLKEAKWLAHVYMVNEWHSSCGIKTCLTLKWLFLAVSHTDTAQGLWNFNWVSLLHFKFYSYSDSEKDPAKSAVISSFLERWEGLPVALVKKTVLRLWLLLWIYVLDFGIWQKEVFLLCNCMFVFDLTWVSLVSLIQMTQRSPPLDASYEGKQTSEIHNGSLQLWKPEKTAIVICFARAAVRITNEPEIVMTFEYTAL